MNNNLDYKKWSELIDNTGYKQTEIIKDFFKDYNNEKYFIEVKNKDIIDSFKCISDKIIICFDLEFQDVTTKHINELSFFANKNTKGEYYIPFSRELGMIFFIPIKKDYKTVSYAYIGSIFVNFNDVAEKKGYEFISNLIQSKYASVSPKNKKKMIENEKIFSLDGIYNRYFGNINKDNFLEKTKSILNFFMDIKKNTIYNILSDKQKQEIKESIDNIMKEEIYDEVRYQLGKIKKIIFNIPFNTYYDDLTKDYQTRFLKQKKIYYNDKLVQDRLLKNKEEDFLIKFKSVLSICKFVIKGNEDLKALNNTYKLYNISNISLNCKLNNHNIYDIEIFNPFSRIIFKSAKLEDTFNGLIESKIYKDNFNKYFDEIITNIGGGAHNPVTDSLYTIIVAILINAGLLGYYGKINKKGGANYYYKYKKYIRKCKLLEDKLFKIN